MAHQTRFHWSSSSRSHVGLVRKINEDSCFDQPEQRIWAVADGMGGHTLGDFASRMVVDTLKRIVPPPDLTDYLARVRDGLLAVNSQLRTEALNRDAHIIGSTVVVLIADDSFCAWLWAGDSRIYHFRNGHLRQLTRDHSQFEELKARGHLSAEQAAALSVPNMITRAIGGADTLELEEGTLKVDDGDMFLLCSDGLSNSVSEEEMLRALIPGDCGQACQTLLDTALQQGGRDNISVVVVQADDLHSVDKTALNPAL